MEALVTDLAKEEAKWRKTFVIFMFIANFCFPVDFVMIFSQVNSTEGVLSNDEFWKKVISQFLKDP